MRDRPHAPPISCSERFADAKVASLDVYRGFVILTMVFVNYLAGIKDIPAWAKHMPADVDGLTLVDVVFPGFLFIVGVAIPLSLNKRLARGDSIGRLLVRIGVRTAGLLFIGVILVNEHAFSSEATGMSKSVWYLLALSCVVVLWSTHPSRALTLVKVVSWALRLAAVAVLAYLVVIFRRANKDGQITWLQSEWWGILGLIGWAYLACCICYLLCRGNSTGLMGILGLMIALYTGSKEGVLDRLEVITEYVGVGEVFGTLAAIVMAGVLVGNGIPGGPSPRSAPAQMRFTLFLGLGLLAAGMLLRPLHGGISKIHATESYALVSSGICALLYLPFYYLIDVQRLSGVTGFLGTVGGNALLAYLLPDIVSFLLDVFGKGNVLWPYGSGSPGAANAAVVTVLIMCLTWVLTKFGIRLRL
jgi:heparan-alpha-glucosaminide N-acetyltransferase